MTCIRALLVPGGIALERQDEDEAFEIRRARQDLEAAAEERAVITIPPPLQPCRVCRSLYCGQARCRFDPPPPKNPCQYYKDRECDCGARGSGICVEAA